MKIKMNMILVVLLIMMVHPKAQPIHPFHSGSYGKCPGAYSGGVGEFSDAMILLVKKSLAPDEVLMEFDNDEFSIYIFIVTREFSKHYTISLDTGFWSQVSDFTGKMRMADLSNHSLQARYLTSVLLDKTLGPVKDKSRLILISKGNFRDFPFELLSIPGTPRAKENGRYVYLIEKWDIVYSHNIVQWIGSRIRSQSRLTDQSSGTTVSFVGFSPGFSVHECITELPEAGREIAAIGKMFVQKGGSSLLLLNDMSAENKFKSVCGIGKVLHIATHSFLRNDRREIQGLLFYEFGATRQIISDDDGLLGFDEISRLNIQAELIVVNSCSSAGSYGDNSISDNIFAESFLEAGARNVLCTRWNVSDRTAQMFMIGFYRSYLEGYSISKSLQKAKIMMIRQEETSLPVNWAGYVLIGS